MAGLLYYTDKRRVLPQLERTTTYRDTLALIDSPKVSKQNWPQPIIRLKDESLEEKLQEWRKSKNYNLAGDILSQAILAKRTEEFAEVKKYLLTKYPSDNIFRWLFENQVREFTNKERIEYNHKKLKLEPKDALAWTDQAINFLIVNDREEAIKCVEEAIRINSNMGFIVRNASRIFSLTGDNGRSIKVLKDSEYYSYDPQILSAEIAFSQLEDRKTGGLSIADKLLNDSRYYNHEKSELASTLGTIEFFKRNFKKSEELFDLSLVAPNKNSFAQSLWYKKEDISPHQFGAYVDSNEIQTHRYSKDNNFKKALYYALKWIEDEPYSVRPYRVSSYITGVLFGNNTEAYDLIKKGMESQRLIKGDNYSLKEEMEFNNDMAYHLLKSDRVEEAEIYIKPSLSLINKLTKKEDLEYVNIATLGLYAYKIKDINLGQKLYRTTITHFMKANKMYLAGSAFLNFFEEEINVADSLESLEKLRKELDQIIPDVSTRNELIIRKTNSLKIFENAMLQLKSK